MELVRVKQILRKTAVPAEGLPAGSVDSEAEEEVAGTRGCTVVEQGEVVPLRPSSVEGDTKTVQPRRQPNGERS